MECSCKQGTDKPKCKSSIHVAPKRVGQSQSNSLHPKPHASTAISSTAQIYTCIYIFTHFTSHSRTILLGIVPRTPTARRTSTSRTTTPSGTPRPSLEVAGDAISATTAVARAGSLASTSTPSCTSSCTATACYTGAIGLVPTVSSGVFVGTHRSNSGDVTDRTKEAGVGRRTKGGGEGPLHAAGRPDGLQAAVAAVRVIAVHIYIRFVIIGIAVAGRACSTASVVGTVRILLLSAVPGVAPLRPLALLLLWITSS